jgi:hypothetical protein
MQEKKAWTRHKERNMEGRGDEEKEKQIKENDRKKRGNREEMKI